MQTRALALADRKRASARSAKELAHASNACVEPTMASPLVDCRRSSRPLAAFLLALLSTGCTRWEIGQIRYRDNPDLAQVALATGERKQITRRRMNKGDVEDTQAPNIWTPFTEVGPVHTVRSGRESCEDLVVSALRDLLADARTIGATRVQEVKFRRQWHWSGGEPICRRRLGTGTVEVQGMAVKNDEVIPPPSPPARSSPHKP